MPARLLHLLLCLSLLVSSIGSTTAGTHVLASLSPAATSDTRADARLDARSHAPTDADNPAGKGDCGHGAPAAEATIEDALPEDSEDCLQRCLDLWLQQCAAVFTAIPQLGEALGGDRLFDRPAIAWMPRNTSPPKRPPIA